MAVREVPGGKPGAARGEHRTARLVPRPDCGSWAGTRLSVNPRSSPTASVGWRRETPAAQLPARGAEALLPRLQLGERTPLPLVRGAPVDRLSWYQRIGRAGLSTPSSPTSCAARSPQNLFPIGALETHLRHRLGDPRLLRSALEAQLAGAGAG